MIKTFCGPVHADNVGIALENCTNEIKILSKNLSRINIDEVTHAKINSLTEDLCNIFIHISKSTGMNKVIKSKGYSLRNNVKNKNYFDKDWANARADHIRPWASITPRASPPPAHNSIKWVSLESLGCLLYDIEC